MKTESGKSEKEMFVSILKSIGVEKQSCYQRIEKIKELEHEINARLGEIYTATRTDI